MSPGTETAHFSPGYTYYSIIFRYFSIDVFYFITIPDNILIYYICTHLKAYSNK